MIAEEVVVKLALDVWYEDWQRSETQRGPGGDTGEPYDAASTARGGDDRLRHTRERALTEYDRVDDPEARLNYLTGYTAR